MSARVGSVRVITFLAGKRQRSDRSIHSKETQFQHAGSPVETLQRRQDAESRHDHHQEPASTVRSFGTQIPAANHHHGSDDRKDGKPEEYRIHPRSEDHRLGEEGDHSDKDKEHEQEFLHDNRPQASTGGKAVK